MLKIGRLAVFWVVVAVLFSTLAWAKVHSVTLTWHTAGGAVYNVYRCDSKGQKCRLIASRLKSAKYVDKQVKAGDSYRYKVTAVDQAGRESVATEGPATVPRD
jgi:fibronectin type 3 domain-containing protein